MKRYILLSYNGENVQASVIAALGTVIKNAGVTSEDVHGITMNEAEVAAIIAKNASVSSSRELSPVESACIYAKQRFGNYFGNGLKLTLAVSEAAINGRNDEALISAIEILSRGVSSRISIQYGITKEVISVFKQINQNLKDV